MHRSKIEWVLNPDNKTLGWVWNPLTGCLNHVNGMCKGGNFPCYAYRLATTRLRERYLANKITAPQGFANRVLPRYDPFYPRFWPERLADPYAGKSALGKPKGVFVCDMSDLFGIGIPEDWTRQVLHYCKMSSQHRFYLLTKQPQNLVKFSPFPDNCWVGVTATDKPTLGRGLYVGLEKIEAAIKYISFEPLLGSTDLDGLDLLHCGIKWVIIGAQTKPTVYPKIEWVQEIVQAADKAGIPVFLKNNLKQGLITKMGSTPSWATEYVSEAGFVKLRQEL
ncbi:hypothetical protein LCGC14_2137780, partial [marine sediment metagenome]